MWVEHLFLKACCVSCMVWNRKLELKVKIYSGCNICCDESNIFLTPVLFLVRASRNLWDLCTPWHCLLKWDSSRLKVTFVCTHDMWSISAKTDCAAGRRFAILLLHKLISFHLTVLLYSLCGLAQYMWQKSEIFQGNIKCDFFFFFALIYFFSASLFTFFFFNKGKQ